MTLKQITPMTNKTEPRKEKCAYCGEILFPDIMPLTAYQRHYDGNCTQV